MNRAPRTLTVTVPSPQVLEDLGPMPDGVEVLVWPMDGPAPGKRLDLVVVPYMSGGSGFRWLDGVETGVLQGQSIGYDEVAVHLPPGRQFANAASVHETATSELALALVLASQRRLPELVHAQAAQTWMQERSTGLADQRVLLLGYGGVGKATAARLAPFEVDLVPVARQARDEDGVHVHGVDELPELLPHADIVILTLPGGDATRHIVDDAVLAALPDGALVVNVGRGSLIDTAALVDHAGRGRIRAALDVTDPEPLPAGHPLWASPGVLIAPHVGGLTAAMRPRAARLIRQQIERLLRGEAPLNVVIGG
ncbi:Phosphoglycerate dehydrogenase [Microbacterium sp. C448]|uniref:2-hydroxyacid dehydrogenase n=1 Tax=Microbacterium sp. C448 TaxID=1177594 RepID=UPI0003DE34F2|nr:2-hydroxyacid dehydrogenase [Microbacterium sp. C448]CDK01334.1 Phosphoglycerate dehydrogenase [Microbacterium sp. C448]